MMNRILKRPMFRMGGRSDDGIMSVRRGYQEGGDVGFFTRIMDAINPPSGKVLKRMQDVQKAPSLGEVLFSPSKAPLEFRTQAEADEFLEANPNNIRPIKILGTGETINLMGSAEAAETDAGKDTDKKITVTNEDGATQKLSDNDLKTMYEDLLPLFKSELSADDDELKRQKFLELAKFGANLLAQPGGDLIGSVGRAAAPSIEGLTRVAETRRRANQAAKSLALEAALKQSDPGAIRKQVRDIMALDPDISQKDALAKVLSTGSATRESTAQGRVENNAAAILASGTVDNDLQAIQIAENIEDAGKKVGDFRKDPGEGERKKGTYYVIKMPDGNFEIGKYKGKDNKGQEDFAEPGDEDF